MEDFQKMQDRAIRIMTLLFDQRFLVKSPSCATCIHCDFIAPRWGILWIKCKIQKSIFDISHELDRKILKHEYHYPTPKASKCLGKQEKSL